MTVNYEYKCVPGPSNLVVKSSAESSKAIASYANIINAEATDGWEFYSLETMSVSEAPGCFSKPEPPTLFNMLVFRREK